jgi:hypothetical protein
LSWLGLLAALLEPPSLLDGSSGMRPATTWLQVREQTTCEAMQDDHCLGRYGFTVEASGRFIAGPSDRGSKVEGTIEPAELQRIASLAGRFSPQLGPGQKNCSLRTLPGIRDQVDIAFSDGAVVRTYDLGGTPGKLCYIGAWSQAQRLHDVLHKLMSRYYPVPFPAR